MELFDERIDCVPIIGFVLLDLVAHHVGPRLGHADTALAHAPVEKRDGKLKSDDLLVEQVRIGRPELFAGLGQPEPGIYRGRSAPFGLGLGDACLGVERSQLVAGIERRVFQRLVQYGHIVDLDGGDLLVEHRVYIDVLAVTQVRVEPHALLADCQCRVVDRQAVVEHAQLQLEQLVVGDAPQFEPFFGYGIEGFGIAVVLDGDGMPGFAQQQAEIVAHGLHRNVLHGFDVGAFGQFVLFRGDLLIPFEAVVGKERLGVGKRDGL